MQTTAIAPIVINAVIAVVVGHVPAIAAVLMIPALIEPTWRTSEIQPFPMILPISLLLLPLPFLVFFTGRRRLIKRGI